MNRAPGHQPPEGTSLPALQPPRDQPTSDQPAGTTTLIGRRSSSLARRIAPIGASLALVTLGLGLGLGLGLRTPPASAQNTVTEGPSTRSTGAASPGTLAIPANTNAGAPAANETPESLSQSIQRRKDFPFPVRCDGNTQEMVACLWQRRDRGDLRLRKLLGNEQVLEHWRTARLTVCRRSSERGAGGSIQPLLWLGCENALNSTLIEQITSPLLR